MYQILKSSHPTMGYFKIHFTFTLIKKTGGTGLKNEIYLHSYSLQYFFLWPLG